MINKFQHITSFCLSNNIKFLLNEPMSSHTSLGIGGAADIAIFPDAKTIIPLLQEIRKLDIPCEIFGGGTNILVMDAGIPGVVIFTEGMARIMEKENGIYVQSGVSLQRLISFCIDKGLSGIEAMAGIPGAVGGAVAGNAGSYGSEMKDVVVSVDVLSDDGEVVLLSKDEARFSYRRSKIPELGIMLGALLSFKQDDPVEIKKRYSGFLTRKKTAQPVSMRSAGCVFKNPEGVSAGKLIDEAGCKGMRRGGIEVSPMHANFFVNKGGGTADDFLKLMDIVAGRIKERYGIILEPEIRMIAK
jgi:UDP-N-acetylmuramate dehydrogenase